MLKKRFYCSPAQCRWMIKQEKEQFYPDWDDCTDMTDKQFLNYVIETTPNAANQQTKER